MIKHFNKNYIRWWSNAPK